MTPQLPLGIGLAASASFANYVPAAENQAIPRIVQEVACTQAATCLYLWGKQGTGKSHLLQAACQLVTEQGGLPAYLPLKQCINHSPELLEGLEHLDLVCLDDVHAIVGFPTWERAIFHLFNCLREAHIPLLLSAHTAPKGIGFQRSDLVSRLGWGGVFMLSPLQPAELMLALQAHAKHRGLVLSPNVARYVVDHSPPDMSALLQRLDALDYASLSARRKLTIPFVRDLLQQQFP